MHGKQLAIADDKHDGSVLDVDNQVVADLGQQYAEGLGNDDIEHGLHMGHADGLGALGLAGINGQKAAADRFCHIGAGVDGYHKQGGHKYAGPLHQGTGEVRQAIVDEHGLQNHGGSAENFHIDPNDCTDYS